MGYQDTQVDQCVITGMGGDEIMKIISQSPIAIKSYILSPQHNNIDVKKFMLKIGYEIDYDIIVNEKNKFYNIFRCNKSENVGNLSDFDLLFGKSNFNNELSDIDEFVNSEINKLEKLFKEKNVDSVELENYMKLLYEYIERKQII